MDLRTLPANFTPEERCDERRKRVETALLISLPHLKTREVGHADERNCEQMIGSISVPVGYAGPLTVHFSSNEEREVHLPLATTEAALVASVNRGCKALTLSGGVRTRSIDRGISRSLAFRVEHGVRLFTSWLDDNRDFYVKQAESTSSHLKVITAIIDASDPFVFLTLSCDTDEAMGMNMITIAAQAAGEWIETHAPKECRVSFVTVAGNVDSDKKPSRRTKERGRGFEVTAEATIDAETIRDVLKSSPEAMLRVADAKLNVGSTLAGALGTNLHAANILAALYIATGQDAAHVVEGSLADTAVTDDGAGLHVKVHLPAIIVGVRGGGTTLPSQSDALTLLMHPTTSLAKKAQLAETVAAAVLAGELSLLAAQASHVLAASHRKLARE